MSTIPKVYFLTFLLFGIATSASAKYADSIMGVWNNASQSDSIRVEAFQSLISEVYKYSNPDSALLMADELQKFCEQKGYKRGMAIGYSISGNVYYLKNEYQKALEYFEKGLKVYEGIGDKMGISFSLNNIGLVYFAKSNQSLALDYFQKSLAIREKVRDKKGIAASLNNIALIYYKQGNFIRSLEYHKQSLEINEEIGDKEGIAISINNIGKIFYSRGEISRALANAQKSLELYRALNSDHGVASSFANIGSIFYDQMDYPKALFFFMQSLQVSERVGDRQGIANVLINIGNTYSKQGNYKKAQESYLKSLDLSNSINDKMAIASGFESLGKLSLILGNYKDAALQCEKGLIFALAIGDISSQKDICGCLYDAYKSLGNGYKALGFHEQMLVLTDSLKKEETGKKLQQMEFEKTMLQDSIEKAEDRRKIQEAHVEEVRQNIQTRNVFIGIGIIILALAGGIYNRLLYVRRSKAELQREKDRSDNLLLNILPEEIAKELKEKGEASARDFDMVTILFTDFKGFTEQSAKLSAAELVSEINHCFKAFDGIIEKHGIEKIKTIGDSYMAAGGLPIPSDDAVKRVVLAAFDMQEFVTRRKAANEIIDKPAFEMRVGINTGPVVAGIVGIKKFQYDIWGDTVNTASRVESSGEVGKVNISQATYELLKNDKDFIFEARGKISAKGKGEIEMWFVRKLVHDSH